MGALDMLNLMQMAQQQGQKPGTPQLKGQPTSKGAGGAFNKLDSFIGSPGGGFLMNILAQSGYSPMPHSPLGAIGKAALMTSQQQAGRQDAAAKRKLMEAQGKYYTSRAEADSAGAKRIVQSAQPMGNGNIGYINAFTGELVDTGVQAAGKGQVFDMRGVGWVEYDPVQKTLTKIEDERVIREAIGDREKEKVAGGEQARTEAIPKKAEAQAQIEARLDLPGARIAFDKAMGEIERLRDHPGKSGSQGIKGKEFGFGLSTKPFPGTDEADFVAIRDQAAGGAFLTAYQQLKGGGPITDLEGQAALSAMTRMANPDITEREFDRALDDFVEALEAGYKKLENAAAGDFSVIEKAAKAEIDAL